MATKTSLRKNRNLSFSYRKGYSLDRVLIERGNGDEKENQLPRAKITTWTTGAEIIETLKTKLDV